jgi:hypothetical protein
METWCSHLRRICAEFALNRAVDWLFFTGKLPSDPIGRLFATRRLRAAHRLRRRNGPPRARLDAIRAVHAAVEHQRGQRIPDGAHRDVLTCSSTTPSERVRCSLGR